MGRHNKRRTTSRRRRIASVTGTTAITAAVLVVGLGGVANAAPTQGGVSTAPQTQGGVSTAPPTQGGVSTSGQSAPVKTWTEVPVEYQQPTQPLDNWDYNNNRYVAPDYQNTAVTPIDYTQLHLPTQLDAFTAPILAPEDKIRFGRYIADRPNWISEETADRTNGQTAVIEAQVTDFWRSTGIETDAAQRLAAAQIGGGAAGALAGATAAATPAATIGALIGGTIGGTSAVGLATPILTPLGLVPAGVVGTAAGAGIGAAVAGVPAATLGALGGGLSGVVAASAYGAGDLGEPIDFDIPNVDQDAITADTTSLVSSWESVPFLGPAATTALRNAAGAAPTLDHRIRDNLAATPGGTGIVSALDQAAIDFRARTAVPGLPLEMIANAIGAGFPA